MPDLEIVEGGAAVAQSAPPAPKKYRASIHPTTEVPADFAALIFSLESALQLKIWCLIQQGEEDFDEMGMTLYKGLLERKDEILARDRVGLLLHSPGGQITWAYKIARLFQERTDEFFTIVPLYAKSAATLIAVGGKQIIMGSEAELGPLDVQLWNDEAEEYNSALDAVQAFERLNSYALAAYDQAMALLVRRTGKKPTTLMPAALQYATSIVSPLADKIDTIELTKKSRELRVAEEYAKRVMRANYTPSEYTTIASALVERYPAHSFVIGPGEAGSEWGQSRVLGSVPSLGLKVTRAPLNVEGIFTGLLPYLFRDTIIGRIVEVNS
jgi:Serine dehydrogenase proteinase